MAATLFVCALHVGAMAQLPGLLARLDPDERARAARFRFDRDRLAFAAAHALLRHALDHVAGAARPWRFVADRFGKPALDPPLPGLQFNLSHAERMVAVAIADRPLGIDVEAAPRGTELATILPPMLAASEIAELGDGHDRADRLLRLWVAKEAVAKAIGQGLSLPFDRIVLTGTPPRLAALPAPHDPHAWMLRTERHGDHWLGLATDPLDRGIVRITPTVADLLAPGKN